MKESISCAKTVARSLLTEEQKEYHYSNPQDIHCPSTSTPKDGPSAGGAICLAIFSILSNHKLRSDSISMTGEIDLQGNITAIGGLGPKLHGAKKAGIRIAIIPRENQNELDRLRQEKNHQKIPLLKSS